jgi:hypothetical protein
MVSFASEVSNGQASEFFSLAMCDFYRGAETNQAIRKILPET